MNKNQTFFYQGNHTSGANFYYNENEKTLSVVTTHAINFDNDEEGLHLKKLDNFIPYKTLENVYPDAIELKANELLNEMDHDFQTLLSF